MKETTVHYSAPHWLLILQIVLLILILIGIALLCTQKFWVPQVVEFILQSETQ